ncbi:GNAT family N-acetyltransferase [Actinomadura rayongensis]|uniref:GNAT family N-acetyltransferase n=1 Tax=Actinomadura rayongensis TaxID=1429076 RepID=A0A6I4WN44_9ACTN|nr:GNAT family N-acetyltransferase [Actinomadura rayongensis]MXQ68112.1 GNAT family N-acetyltransferase [Actinomadura rayongensis]
MSRPHPLDRPAYASLTGPHAHFAEWRGNVVRYPADVSPFLVVPERPDAADWADVAALAGPGTVVPLVDVLSAPPDTWEMVMSLAGVQLIDNGVTGSVDAEAVRLTAADVPEMMALVERTKPGPFLSRTIELGTYLGIRRDGRLVAMAGERLHPPGFTEISAVCTDAAYRGQGLATRLVRTLVAEIRARGETPFMHAAAHNTTAIRLYESLGFQVRRTATFAAARVPGEVAAA